MLATAAQAQGLAGVAKKTEEQRKSNTVPTTVLTVRPSAAADGPVRLTEAVLQQYLQARLALADLRRADKTVDGRLYTATKNAKHYDDLGPAYAHPDIADLLGTYGLGSDQYLQIETAMLRGRDYAQYPQLSKERLSPVQRENVDFVKAHMGLVRDVLDRAKAAEKGLKWWTVIPNFH